MDVLPNTIGCLASAAQRGLPAPKSRPNCASHTRQREARGDPYNRVCARAANPSTQGGKSTTRARWPGEGGWGVEGPRGSDRTSADDEHTIGRIGAFDLRKCGLPARGSCTTASVGGAVVPGQSLGTVKSKNRGGSGSSRACGTRPGCVCRLTRASPAPPRPRRPGAPSAIVASRSASAVWPAPGLSPHRRPAALPCGAWEPCA